MGIYYISLGHLLHFTWALWMSAISRGSRKRCLTHSAGFRGNLWPTDAPAVTAGKIEACHQAQGALHAINTCLSLWAEWPCQHCLAPTLLLSFLFFCTGRVPRLLSTQLLNIPSWVSAILYWLFSLLHSMWLSPKRLAKAEAPLKITISLFSGKEKCLQDAQEYHIS